MAAKGWTTITIRVVVDAALYGDLCAEVDDKSGGNLSLGDVLAEYVGRAFGRDASYNYATDTVHVDGVPSHTEAARA